MRFALFVILIVAAFLFGVIACKSVIRTEQDARARIAPAPTAVVPDTAQDYIRQYSCYHAITTGNYLTSKGCV